MDYTEEIAANNARIAELKAELAKLESAPAMGSDAMDYALAANRADYGDLSGAQYHLNKPEERARLAKLTELNNGTDKETQYATLQDNVIEAEQELALGQSSKNTAIIRAAQRKLQNAQLRLAMFEKKNPNLVKMHWNWRGEAQKALGPSIAMQQAPENSIEGVNFLMGQLLQTGTDGNVYLKEGADVGPVIDEYKKIPYWWENEEIRKHIKYLNELKTPTDAAAAPTAKNIATRKLDESVFKGGLWNDNATRAEFKKMYDAMSVEDKNTEEGMKIKNALNKWSRPEYNQWLKDMDAEARWLLGNKLSVSEKDLAEAEKKFTLDGWTWELKNGKWKETSGKWRKKDSKQGK